MLVFEPVVAVVTFGNIVFSLVLLQDRPNSLQEILDFSLRMAQIQGLIYVNVSDRIQKINCYLSK